jgi:uncharacterized membrane protein YjjB (DUF3815 family)
MPLPIYVRYIHILFTGPFLAYVGLAKPDNSYIYYFMAALAIFAGLYLLYKVFGSPWRPDKIWYIAHLLLFIPLIFYVSLYKKNMNPTFFSFLAAVGIGAIGYHLIKLLFVAKE